MLIGSVLEMGSAEEVGQQLEFDVDETIFVAVGTDVDEGQTTLFWAVQNFAGKQICVLHVHQPAHEVARKNEEPSSDTLKEHVAKAFQEFERPKLYELLNRYFVILSKQGVQAQKVWIEMNSVEKGIVEIISQYSIRWLVMGSEAERCNLKIKVQKSFLCMPTSTYMLPYLVCLQRASYILKGGQNGKIQSIAAAEFRYRNLPIRPSKTRVCDLKTSRITVLQNFADAQEKENAFNGILRRVSSQGLVDSKCSNNGVLSTSRTTLLLKNEGEKDGGQPISLNCNVLEKAMMNVEYIKWKEFAEEVKFGGEEDAVMAAKLKVRSLENLCAEEVSKRQEITEILERKKQEAERLNDERDALLKELDKVQEQTSLLERQASEYQCNVEELEEKIFTAVELLVSFKEQRDKLRIEHEAAMNKLRQLKNRVKKEPPRFCRAAMPTISFMEINEATRNFDPSWKIGEGRRGSVYKGLLRHMDVAIKMLPSYGSHSQSEFQYEVEVLSRVRHPNLVSIIGACPESRSIIYEILKNRSLEEQLAGKDYNRPLPWQIRTRIAADICSALIFLHYNEPCIVHGDLKPTKILLDANFVGKLGGLGISRLIPQEATASNFASTRNMSKENEAYMDPGYLETGRFTPESDIYSFGVTLLRILTGRAPLGIVKDVKCALENEKIGAVLDLSAGDWPLDLAEQMALVALRCCEKEKSDRPDLVSELWSVLEPMRSIASTSFSVLKKHSRVPAHFTCPIFQDIMQDPLIAADGFTYEAEAIRGWFKSGHDTSPMTNLKLEHCNLVPNYALLNAIQEWQHQL